MHNDPARAARRTSFDFRRTLLELQQNDFRAGAEAEGRTPGARAIGSVDEHFTETVEAVSERAVYALGEAGEREELAAVGVAVHLEADARFGGDGRLVGRVGEQDAGRVAIDFGILQHGAKAVGAHM